MAHGTANISRIGRREWAAVAVVGAAGALVSLDTMVNIAFPAITASFAIDVGEGDTALVKPDNTPLAFNDSITGVVTDLRWLSVNNSSGGSKLRLVAGNDKGNIKPIEIKPLNAQGLRRLNWRELPWYWLGFDWFPFAALMAVLVPAALAAVFGWFAFRSRVTGVYLSIITQALTYALLLAFFRNDMGFGGNNGLTDFKEVLGVRLSADGTRAGLLLATALALCGMFVLARWLTRSRFGKVLVAVRDAESRTRFLGYRPERYKLVVWTLSAAMAGIGGALYVPQVGIINPGEFAPANSIEAVIWVAVGGRGTLYGPILGAVLVNLAKTLLTGSLPEAWLFALGGLFVVVTLFLPRGLVGLRRERRPTAAREAPQDAST